MTWMFALAATPIAAATIQAGRSRRTCGHDPRATIHAMWMSSTTTAKNWAATANPINSA
jgi:hypothetical protein